MTNQNDNNKGGGQGNNNVGNKDVNKDGNKDSNNNDKKGFASMSESQRSEISSQGGKAAHESGNAHEFTSEEAREAGRKGGQQSQGGNSGNNN